MSKLSEKIKQAVVGSFIGTGGKEKNQERIELIKEINNLKKEIDSYKDLNFKNIENVEQKIMCTLAKFKTNMDKFLNNRNKFNYSESYAAINSLSLSYEPNSKKDEYVRLNNFYKSVVAFLNSCNKAPKYALIAGKDVKNSVESLKKSLETLMGNIHNKATQQDNVLNKIIKIFNKYNLQNLKSKGNYRDMMKILYNLFNDMRSSGIIGFLNKIEQTINFKKIDVLDDNADLETCMTYKEEIKDCIDTFFIKVRSSEFLTFSKSKINTNINSWETSYNDIMKTIDKLLEDDENFKKIEEKKLEILEKTNGLFSMNENLKNLLDSIDLKKFTIGEIKIKLKELCKIIQNGQKSLDKYHKDIYDFLSKLCKEIENLSDSSSFSLDAKSLNFSDFDSVKNLKIEKIDDKNIYNIKFFFEQFKEKIELIKKQFEDLIKNKMAIDQVSSVMRNLTGTSFYDDICSNKYGKTKWLGMVSDGVDLQGFVHDVIKRSLFISSTIKTENLGSFNSIKEIFNDIKENLREIKPNNLQSRENLKNSISKIKNISNNIKNTEFRDTEKLSDDTEKLINDCSKKFIESYEKLLEKIKSFGDKLDSVETDANTYIDGVLEDILKTPKNSKPEDIINYNTRNHVCDKIQEYLKKFEENFLSIQEKISSKEYSDICKKVSSIRKKINDVCTAVKNIEKIKLSELTDIYNEVINNIFRPVSNLAGANNKKKIDTIIRSSDSNFKIEKSSLENLKNHSKNTCKLFRNLWYLKTYFIAQDKIIENLEKFKKLWIIDNNCISGMSTSDSIRNDFIKNKDNTEWKNKYGIKNGPQTVSEIIESGLKFQYNHKRMIYMGSSPYYVLTDGKGRICYSDKYPYQNAENSCINLSGDNDKALKEVESYIKNVVKCGRFHIDENEAKQWMP